MAVPRRRNTERLLRQIEESQCGRGSSLQGPFGPRRGPKNSKFTILTFFSHSLCSLQWCMQITLLLESECVDHVIRGSCPWPPPLSQVSGVHRGLSETRGASSLWQHTLCLFLYLQTDHPVQRGGQVHPPTPCTVYSSSGTV